MSLSSILRKELVPFEPLVLPSRSKLEAKTERILQRWPDVVVDAPEQDRERIAQAIKQRVINKQWEQAKLSWVTMAARVIFDEERRTRKDLQSVREFYFDEIFASDHRRFLDAMFSVYMGSYEPGAAHTVNLANALRHSRQHFGSQCSDLLEKIPACLDPHKAHEAICVLMVSMNDPWSGLRSIGIRTPHAPGVMDHAHTSFVIAERAQLIDRIQMRRMLTWLKPNDGPAKTVGAGLAISALLEPWTNSRASEDDASFLTESIVGLYGDPRVRQGGIWSEVSEAAMSVLMRWLTGENIRFFLDVVSKVEDSHMWAPRREFWLKLYERGWIDAAWVAFSALGVQEARRVSKNASGHSTLSYGSQTAGGSRKHTSLLILKIGKKIVVEGSHNYKVHIFEENDAAGPRLYSRAYDCEMIRIRGNPKARAHISGWQDWVVEHL